MTDCWKPEPHQRPTFSQLAASIAIFMESSVFANYLQMERQYLQLDSPNKLLDKSSVITQNQGIHGDYIVPHSYHSTNTSDIIILEHITNRAVEDNML